jgi:hypothetical protein
VSSADQSSIFRVLVPYILTERASRYSSNPASCHSHPPRPPARSGRYALCTSSRPSPPWSCQSEPHREGGQSLTLSGRLAVSHPTCMAFTCQLQSHTSPLCVVKDCPQTVSHIFGVFNRPFYKLHLNGTSIVKERTGPNVLYSQYLDRKKLKEKDKWTVKFSPEDGGNILLRNVGIYVQNHTVLQNRRPTLMSLP